MDAMPSLALSGEYGFMVQATCPDFGKRKGSMTSPGNGRARTDLGMGRSVTLRWRGWDWGLLCSKRIHHPAA